MRGEDSSETASGAEFPDIDEAKQSEINVKKEKSIHISSNLKWENKKIMRDDYFSKCSRIF
jgi:hypothetical protein